MNKAKAEAGMEIKSRRAARANATSTCTITPDKEIVPWLAANGPLAYSPGDPPDRDYYFQYGWVLPGILADGVNKRRHYYFGAPHKDTARDLFDFWQAARSKRVSEVARCHGKVGDHHITAPLAVYSVVVRVDRPGYLLMQHGSFQLVEAVDQPELPSGEVLIYRGIGDDETFRWSNRCGGAQKDIWQRYVAVQAYVLADAIRSFNSIHDRASRSETGHLRDSSWITDDIARQNGLELDNDDYTANLWAATHQSFSLARWVAECKFGPSFVVARTPLTNIRLTTFFAGEHEVRVIDPDLVVFLECHGCKLDHHQRAASSGG